MFCFLRAKFQNVESAFLLEVETFQNRKRMRNGCETSVRDFQVRCGWFVAEIGRMEVLKCAFSIEEDRTER